MASAVRRLRLEGGKEERKLGAGQAPEERLGCKPARELLPGLHGQAGAAEPAGKRKKEGGHSLLGPSAAFSPNLCLFFVPKALSPVPFSPGFLRMALCSRPHPLERHTMTSKSASHVPSPQPIPNPYFQPPRFHKLIIFIRSRIQLSSPFPDFSPPSLPNVPVYPRYKPRSLRSSPPTSTPMTPPQTQHMPLLAFLHICLKCHPFPQAHTKLTRLPSSLFTPLFGHLHGVTTEYMSIALRHVYCCPH